MSNFTNINGPTLLGSSGVLRYIPQPKSRNSGVFQKLLGAAGDLVSKGAGAVSGIDPQYSELINRQMELQQQMMLVSMVSNTEKTQHDTRMAPVRNLRVA